MSDIVALGAGRMGRGIAQVFAYAGHDVCIIDFKDRPADISATLLAEAKQEVAENLEFLRSLDIIGAGEIPTILDRIQTASNSDAPDVLAKAKYVFEGVPEILDAKKDALGRAGALAADAVIASTTSTMLVTELAGFTPHPENFLNAHFLNPAYLIPLVEVSPSDQTDPEKLDQFTEFLESIGKVPVRCAASPGYIVPRLQSVAMNEACRMVEEGVATAEDIDRAVRAGFGIRYATMGLIEFLDYGGVDILYYASDYLKNSLGGERYERPKIVEEMVARGDLGLKTGKGFYDYEKIDVDAYRSEKLADFITLLKHLDQLPKKAAN